MKRFSFLCNAFPLQTNGRLGLLTGRSDHLFGVLARRGNLSVGYAARLPDSDDRRKEGKNACDDGLPVVEELRHLAVLYPVLKRHGLSALRLHRWPSPPRPCAVMVEEGLRSAAHGGADRQRLSGRSLNGVLNGGPSF